MAESLLVRPVRDGSWRAACLVVVVLVTAVMLLILTAVSTAVRGDRDGQTAAAALALTQELESLRLLLLQQEVQRHDLLLGGGDRKELLRLQGEAERAFDRIEELSSSALPGPAASPVSGLRLAQAQYELATQEQLQAVPSGRPGDSLESDARLAAIERGVAQAIEQYRAVSRQALEQMRDDQRTAARAIPLLGGLVLIVVACCVRTLLVQRRRLSELRAAAMQQTLIDDLTGLANRAGFTRVLHQQLAKARPGQLVVLMLLDLDRFKVVNDTFGHHVGDGFLRVVAARLQDALPDADVIARLGGDEFVVLMTGVLDAARARECAQELAVDLSRPAIVHDVLADVGASIGVACHDASLAGDECVGSMLLRRADVAMYRAKALKAGPVLDLGADRPTPGTSTPDAPVLVTSRRRS